MKILEVIPQLTSGGGERFTVDLCNELCKRHNVRLIVLYSLEEYGFYLKDLCPEVEIISMNKKSGLCPKLMFRILTEIRHFDPDVVHSHLRGIMYTALSSIISRNGKKYFHTIHSDAEKEAGDSLSRIFRKLLFKNKFVKPIAISDESLASFQKFYGINCPKIYNGRAIPNTIEVSYSIRHEMNGYKKTSSTRLIINLARIMKVKRQPLIARVCKRLMNEGYDFTMLIIGRGEEQDVVNDVESADCECVKLLGERHNPLEYLKMADGYCLFSEYEGMPISLIEALGTGTVPICTPVGGIVNVVNDRDNGILAKDITENECYMALKRFLDMPDNELEKMKQRALSSFEAYSMKECALKYEELFCKELKQDI